MVAVEAMEGMEGMVGVVVAVEEEEMDPKAIQLLHQVETVVMELMEGLGAMGLWVEMEGEGEWRRCSQWWQLYHRYSRS